MIKSAHPSSLADLFGFAAASVARAGAGTLGLVTRLARNLWRKRVIANELLEMDDRMLNDIGLTRGDVVSALSSPLDIDPSCRLRVLAVERRASDRARARARRDEALFLTSKAGRGRLEEIT